MAKNKKQIYKFFTTDEEIFITTNYSRQNIVDCFLTQYDVNKGVERSVRLIDILNDR